MEKIVEKKDPSSLLATGKTKDVEIAGFQFTIKKNSWGEKQDILMECVIKKGSSSEVDLRKMNKTTLLKSIVKHPFPKWDMDIVSRLEDPVGKKLLKEITLFNTLGGDVEKNLVQPSEDEEE